MNIGSFSRKESLSTARSTFVKIALGSAFALAVGAGAAIVASRGGGPDSKNAALVQKPPPTNWTVHVRKPESAPKVLTGGTDFAGHPVAVNCSTCHATTTPNTNLRSGAELTTFHQGLSYKHGDLSCVSCHNSGNYDTLRLADGTALEFTEVMQLCGQCHGPQARDYRNGAHGGMTGHWDLTRGPRHRNNCVDCHDPHAPQYPKVMPVFKPRDGKPNPSTHKTP